MNHVDGPMPRTRYTLAAILRGWWGGYRHVMGLDGKHVRR